MTEPETSALSNHPDGAFRLEKDGAVGVLWFDLPGEKVNKLSSKVMTELDAMIDLISRSSDLDRVIVISGKENIFIAGADISEFQTVPSAADAEKYTSWGQQVFLKLSRLPQVTVALIHGACMGGGTELSLNCDYRLVTDGPKSVIGLPEVKLGIIPAWTGTSRLPRLVGLPAALDVILTGKNVYPSKAKRMGLVDEIVPAAIRLDAAKRFIASQEKPGAGGRTNFWLDGNPVGRSLVFRKAKRSVKERTGGHYPAPFKAIEVMGIAMSMGLEAGIAAEARIASELITGDVAPNLVNLFFEMESAKKVGGKPSREASFVGVLGAGLMGGGITQTLVEKADVPVRMKDINWAALGGGMQAAAKIWQKKVDRKRMTRVEMDLNLKRITTTTDWTGFSNVDVVIEAVVEKLEIKQAVLREFEEIARPEAIFATNTSTIPIARIASEAARPENVIGMHFFSPVDRMPLVEIIRGERTSDETVAVIASLAKRMGKTVVICNDGPGFIVNRLLGPYLNEAGFLVTGGATIDSIDRAMVRFGMPIGPLTLLDEVGIDVAGKASQVLMDAFGDRISASPLVETLVGDGRFGRKNGRGVYLWKKGKRTKPDPSVYRLVGSTKPSPGNASVMAERMVLSMVNEAAVLLDDGIARCAADVDLSMILGTGFPPFRGGLLRYADTIGLRRIVDRLGDLSAKHDGRFSPSAALSQIAAAGSSFYEAYAKS